MLKEKLSPKVQQLLELQNRHDPTAFWGSREMYILFSAIFFIAVLFFFWAKYIRKSKTRSSRVLSSKMPDRISRDGRDRHDTGGRRRWSKRNPTLAETGGLPPVKDISASD